ncbi:MAG: hypothetical protein V1886_03525 [archaeon]
MNKLKKIATYVGENIIQIGLATGLIAMGGLCYSHGQSLKDLTLEGRIVKEAYYKTEDIEGKAQGDVSGLAIPIPTGFGNAYIFGGGNGGHSDHDRYVFTVKSDDGKEKVFSIDYYGAAYDNLLNVGDKVKVTKANLEPGDMDKQFYQLIGENYGCDKVEKL